MVPSMSGTTSTLCLNEGYDALLKALIFHTLAYHLNIATVKAPEPVKNKAEKGGIFAKKKIPPGGHT